MPTLTFLGAARTVTGSRYLLRCSTATILIDAGLFQERRHQGLNWENFGLYSPDVDAVVLTHGHLDHCGWLPKLVKDGCKGRVYCTAATADLVPIILRDSARIQEEDAKTKAKRHAREGRNGSRPPTPLYDTDDAEDAIRRLTPVALAKPVTIAPGVTAEWGENGHILGASWVAVEADGVRSVFSGDIGRWDRPILNDPLPPARADYLVIESTYGDRTHGAGDVEAGLEQAVADSAAAGGNLLIPSFSVERAQELLYCLARLRRDGRLPHHTVYLDSPMAGKVTDLFSRHPEVWDDEMRSLVKAGSAPFDFPGLRITQSVADSKAINEVTSGAVIIAGNGMCTGGRIKHHLAQCSGRPEAMLVFVGYQAEGTLGRELVNGAKEIRLFNRMLPVGLQVRQLPGMSGHADSGELLRWAGEISAPKRAFVTHGDAGAALAFSDLLRSRLHWMVDTPQLRDQVELQ